MKSCDKRLKKSIKNHVSVLVFFLYHAKDLHIISLLREKILFLVSHALCQVLLKFDDARSFCASVAKLLMLGLRAVSYSAPFHHFT